MGLQSILGFISLFAKYCPAHWNILKCTLYSVYDYSIMPAVIHAIYITPTPIHFKIRKRRTTQKVYQSRSRLLQAEVVNAEVSTWPHLKDQRYIGITRTRLPKTLVMQLGLRRTQRAAISLHWKEPKEVRIDTNTYAWAPNSRRTCANRVRLY